MLVVKQSESRMHKLKFCGTEAQPGMKGEYSLFNLPQQRGRYEISSEAVNNTHDTAWVSLPYVGK